MSFGTYFRSLRTSKHITQQQIADAIGKSKMLVSGIETDKNGPFIDKDLDIISKSLGLTKNEKKNLFKEAAKARGKLPKYLQEYLTTSDEAYDLLEMCAQKKPEKEMLYRIMQIIKESN